MILIRWNKRAQAATEMAIFGSLIVLIFSFLLAYTQRQNTEQAVTMEAFRRALQRGNDENASVSTNLIQYRRFVDIAAGFWQGNRNMIGAGASVFWAVPKVGKQARNLAIFRINQDDIDDVLRQRDGRTLTQVLRLDNEDENDNLELRDITTQARTSFSETTNKIENNTQIQNIRTSALSDRITTNLEIVNPGPNKQSERDDAIVETISVTQNLYRDTDGQYKYSSSQPEQTITRSKTWTTPFQN